MLRRDICYVVFGYAKSKKGLILTEVDVKRMNCPVSSARNPRATDKVSVALWNKRLHLRRFPKASPICIRFLSISAHFRLNCLRKLTDCRVSLRPRRRPSPLLISSSVTPRPLRPRASSRRQPGLPGRCMRRSSWSDSSPPSVWFCPSTPSACGLRPWACPSGLGHLDTVFFLAVLVFARLIRRFSKSPIAAMPAACSPA